MSARRLVAVSAGLSQPSSTRLLADRLTTASSTAPTAAFAASEDWGSRTADDDLAQRIARAAGELAALVAARTPKTGQGDLPAVTRSPGCTWLARP